MARIEQSFDYIIVGGGTAGNRISKAFPNVSLLVIERGVAQDDRVTPALGFAPGFGSDIETNLLSTPQPNFEGLAVSQTSGLILGGSSAVNYETWTRGASIDFDQWAEIAGDRRWSWEGMLPYFKTNETFIPSATQKSLQEENEDLHGTDGPITVSHPSNAGKPRDYPLRQDMARFHQVLGAKLIPESNAGNVIGYTEVAQSNYDGQRQFAAKAYLFGPNVTVWTESEVHHIDIEEQRASRVTGIRYFGGESGRKAEGFRVSANVETILSAGALFSPKLLMLSGIGPKEELDKHGIPVKADLPVGKNLSDHPCVSSKWTVNRKDASIGVGPMVTESCDWTAGPPMDWIAFHRAKDSTLEAVSQHLTADEKKYYLSEGKAHWECFTMYGPFDTSERPIKIDPPVGESIVSVFNILVSPLSRGSVKLNSSDPDDPPVVDPALLASPADKEILYDAVRSTTTAMKNLESLDAVEYTIDEALRSDSSNDAVAARVKQGGSTVFHYSGTCAMGTVVDAECRVKGVEGLRVVDASVFPMPLGAHYQAATYALAEQVAEMVVGNVYNG
ncbi:GMC-OxRdtase-N domain-containing protein [Fusarium keratoplasticum]|uniref:GMC-OxRdtase-N domain-containing protein n=1 Tax=Fusarium keratoplasticum TaxID=1328300 RepID=A0ACC0QY95_9HYPO|nr:GMC-OxRdtase-N domain-containing protein [Fusarium keratoplasticum]KAI8669490.1 GMC-OxRdtase-N domain-containing protein [Fusarium keratoplasticum]